MKCVVILFLIVLSNSLFANYSADKVAVAVRIDAELTIDGLLDEVEWKLAKPVSGFIVKDPREGAEPEENTELYFLYNSRYLYIGARMFRKNPENIQSFVSRRDNMGNSERIIITLDTYNNKTTSFSFAVTATGVRADYYHSTDSEGDRDYNYNPVWTARTNIDSLGWTAEFRIPFNQLRFNNDDNLVWGLNANQYTPTNREDIYWVMIPKNQAGWSSRFGKLIGLNNIKQTSRMEFLPYVNFGLDVHREKNHDANPFFKRDNRKFNAGLDFKMGVGPNITLDATINPDFGQVEADAAVVNLTEFETYFDEKRQFFIEGNKLFLNTGVNYYYSRRIGAAPQYHSGGLFQSIPVQSTILGAAKITGRSDKGASFAVLSSVTDEVFGRFVLDTSFVKSRKVVAPLSLFNIARISQEFDKQGSHIGGIITAVNRMNTETTNLFYNDAAYSGGVDANFFFDDKKYFLSGNIGFSHIQGTKERMTIVQKQTTHLAQRADASHLSLDTNATYLTGFISALTFGKNTGKNWLWNVSYYSETPGLDFNDFGRLMHNDEISFSGTLRYRENTPTQVFHNYSFSLYSHYKMNWEYERMETPINFDVSLNFRSRNSLSFGLHHQTLSLSDTRTRGGWMAAIAPRNYYYISYSTDWSKPSRFSASANASHNTLNGETYGASSEYEMNIDRYKIVFGGGYDYNSDPQQYFTTLQNGNNTRYIFSHLKRNTISAKLRINYAFTPDLTLEYFATPFISSGKYLAFYEMTKRASLNYRQYGKTIDTFIEKDENNNYLITDGVDTFTLSNRNFLYRSFRSSMVLRWEYMPGSILYAVWQMNNNEDLKYYDRITGDDFFGSIIAPGINSFMIKFSYWFSPN